jgi:GntR family transcriptional regulator/MocR family aminotransferase
MLVPLKLVRDLPLQQQLYDQLRDLIGSARLTPGTRMPSTRMLADQFSISRITVLLTYERLIAEGYLETLPAKGTFVSHAAQRITSNDAAARKIASNALPPEPLIGRPDPAEFPAQRWRTLLRSSLDRLSANLCDGQPNGGHPALRRAIARWLSTSRGLAAEPDQVIVASGRLQALHIAANMLLRPGGHAVIEDPCARKAETILASAAATLTRVPVDADGLRTDRLPSGTAAMIHVTPEHQRPLGVALSRSRRQELLQWATRADAVVLEEDCDGEFRYEVMDAPPLMALDRDERVVHVGSFAPVLGPGVTLGYLVVPCRLIPAVHAARRLVDDRPGWLEEAALAEFLDSGAYARHLHRLRKVYLSRRDLLIASMRRHFGSSVRLGGGGAGLHLAWTLSPAFGPATLVAETARRCGLDAAPVARSGFTRGSQVVALGFGLPSEQQMQAAVRRLAASLSNGDAATSAMSQGAD